jgi:TFIIH basal transcription factor complex TTD-A subunit
MGIMLHACLFNHVRSDPAVKQILLVMNDKDPFIIEDLDDFHLVIKADEEYRVRSELEAEVCPFHLLVLCSRSDLMSSPSSRRIHTAWNKFRPDSTPCGMTHSEVLRVMPLVYTTTSVHASFVRYGQNRIIWNEADREVNIPSNQH